MLPNRSAAFAVSACNGEADMSIDQARDNRVTTSGVFAALLSEAVTGGEVVMGADVAIAETLIGRILGC